MNGARRTCLGLLAALGAGTWLPQPVTAQNTAQPYPARPITLVVSFDPGGATDLSARVVARELTRLLGQPVNVENRAGAGGRIGTRSVAQAKPDGHTLLWGSGSNLTAAPVLFADQGHVASLVPVSLGATQAFVFVTTPATGARTVAEFVALAKRKPGALNFASAGVGSSNHLLGEIFQAATGSSFTHVPYKGSASAKEALLKGDAQLMDESIAALLPQLRAGQLVPLFVTGDVRDPLLPEVPTAREVGIPDLTITGFFGLLAPAGTPAEVVTRLNAAMKEALAAPAVKDAFAPLGFVGAASTPAELADRIAQGRARYERIVRERGIRAEGA